jgi:hypothetical protein
MMSQAEESSARRAHNRERSQDILRRAGVEWTSNNAGVHCIIQHNGTRVHFWPGTGLYRVESTGTRGRGVANLLRLLGRSPDGGQS